MLSLVIDPSYVDDLAVCMCTCEATSLTPMLAIATFILTDVATTFGF